MMLALLLATQAAALSSPCLDLVRTDPVAARTEATRWRGVGGGAAASACAGLAWAAQENWRAAATAFTEAAHAAETAHDAKAADYWAEAGNAWLAAGEPASARAALGSALAAGTLRGLSLGEAQLDQARALVADGRLEDARTSLDLAVTNAREDPLAWLLSATLARRMADPRRAATDIAEALRRAPDDAAVQLEAGNIAAGAGDAAKAKERWAEAARLQPAGPSGRAAAKALSQFEPAPAGAGTPHR